jgi:CTP:molybdopterin cytidylyltransferase MocA
MDPKHRKRQAGFIHLIYLAAGSGSRFGGDKLRHPLRGKPLCRYGLEMLLSLKDATGWDLTVVTRPDAMDLFEGLPGRLRFNDAPEKGISRSIRMALDALPPDNMPTAFFVADQPFLKPDTVRSFLMGCLSSGRGLGCVGAGGRTGNPCFFSSRYFGELRTLQGDMGGKTVLKRYTHDLFYFEVEKEELCDMDRAEA